MIKKLFGKRIKELRTKENLTQEELAEQASLRDLRARHRESLRLWRQRKKQRESAPAKDEQIKYLASEQNELEVNGI